MKLTVPIARVALLLTMLSPLNARAEPAQPLRWVLADQVRVRAGATTTDRVNGSLSRGAELILKAPVEGDFCFVEGEGLIGYVACKYLSSERVAPPKSGENGFDAQQRWVSGNGVTLREKADINASATGRLSLNSIVKLVNADAGNGYCEVNSVDGLSGYTACRYLALSPVVAVNFQANKEVDNVQPANIAQSIDIQPAPNAEGIEPTRKSLLQRSETAAAAKNSSAYLGKDEDDFPSECKRESGVGWHASNRPESGHLSFSHYICGEKKWMWLVYEAGIADPSRKRSKIVDVLDVTSLRQGESIMQNCSGGAYDDSVFAIGIKEYWDRGFSGKRIRAAWRVNQTTKKFEALPTKGIECSYSD